MENLEWWRWFIAGPAAKPLAEILVIVIDFGREAGMDNRALAARFTAKSKLPRIVFNHVSCA